MCDCGGGGGCVAFECFERWDTVVVLFFVVLPIYRGLLFVAVAVVLVCNA